MQKISQNKKALKFADHKIIANCLNTPVYFAHPHSSWERGTNENTNRLLKQYFPKKAKQFYTQSYLADCRQRINTSPRKCLGFASPAERFNSELRACPSRLNFLVLYDSPFPHQKKLSRFTRFTVSSPKKTFNIFSGIISPILHASKSASFVWHNSG